MRCPRCGHYASREPGGLRCLHRGCWTPLLRALPRQHVSGQAGYGRGGREDRERQHAIDQMYVRPGAARSIMWRLLERLEGRTEDEETVTA